jgi:hypothetical protein
MLLLSVEERITGYLAHIQEMKPLEARGVTNHIMHRYIQEI